MSPDPRVQRLLDELLETQADPERVCASCPELLPEVRRRWRRMLRIRCDLDSLFPAVNDRPPGGSELPHVPGYQIEGVLGRGGMGIVFRARHLRLKRPVALKMILAGAYAVREELERFVHEAEAVAALRHPNIVEVYDAGELDGRPYFTMELVEGGHLSQKIAGAPQPARDAAALVVSVAHAVHAAHQKGIVHRDLTPANILLTPEGTPKVTDFGLALRLEGDRALTLTGLPIGTPSYMAPEQARGDKPAIGPAVDVYALGAILYELLTGRPPFRTESTAATIQQVIAGDPVRPARLNPRVPRDLETICLTCLQTQPARRYPSAAAVAEDLGRFLRGEPIVARPSGWTERVIKWTRRHPSRAAVLAITLLVALVAAGVGGGVIGRRYQVMWAVKDELGQAVRFQQQSALPEASAMLERARVHLGEGAPAWLGAAVERTQRDQQLLERLETIRTTRSTFAEGRDNHLAEVRFNDARADREYHKAFRDAALGDPSDDPDRAAGRVRESVVRVPLVAALDDWAVCAPGGTRRDWVLRVARGADPDDYRDRVRNPDAWEDVAALAEMARTAPVAHQPPPLLLALGERLQAAGGDGVGLLRRVRVQYPGDFWTNFTLARAFHAGFRQGKGDWQEAAACYQKALDLRPNAVAVHNNLGLVFANVGWLEDGADGHWGPGAISIFRRALRIDPDFAPARNNLGLWVKRKGAWWLAIHEYRDAVRADPELPPAHFNLGEITAGGGQINGAIGHYREALRVDPDFARAHFHLGLALLAKRRMDEVLERYPEGDESLNHFRGAALGEAVAYYWQAYATDPEWVATRDGPRLLAQDHARLDEAIGHYRHAVRLEPAWDRPHGALGQALLAKRQFVEADAALARSLELVPPEHTDIRRNLERVRERCRHLQVLERRLPDIVRGTDHPAAVECFEAAELSFASNHFATAARLYADALAAHPQSATDLRAGHRLNAARAAALSGMSRGDDAATLGEPERARWRRQAREWLRLDLDQCRRTLESSKAVSDRLHVQALLARWRQADDFAAIRDTDHLADLPPEEREDLRALWTDVGSVLNAALSPE